MDSSNISEHSVHISKNNEHGKSGVLLAGNDREFAKKSAKPLFMRVTAKFSLA